MKWIRNFMVTRKCEKKTHINKSENASTKHNSKNEKHHNKCENATNLERQIKADRVGPILLNSTCLLLIGYSTHQSWQIMENKEVEDVYSRSKYETKKIYLSFYLCSFYHGHSHDVYLDMLCCQLRTNLTEVCKSWMLKIHLKETGLFVQLTTLKRCHSCSLWSLSGMANQQQAIKICPFHSELMLMC